MIVGIGDPSITKCVDCSSVGRNRRSMPAPRSNGPAQAPEATIATGARITSPSDVTSSTPSPVGRRDVDDGVLAKVRPRGAGESHLGSDRLVRPHDRALAAGTGTTPPRGSGARPPFGHLGRRGSLEGLAGHLEGGRRLIGGLTHVEPADDPQELHAGFRFEATPSINACRAIRTYTGSW